MRKTQKITFNNSRGDELAGLIDFPDDDPPLAFALFAHCFTCSKDAKAAFGISKTLAKHGIAVLRFDFTGLGQSKGDFEQTSFSSNVKDLVAASSFLNANYVEPSLAIGHSLGGTAVLAAVSKMPSIKALVTIASPFSPSHLIGHIRPKDEPSINGGLVPLDVAGRNYYVAQDFVEDLEKHDMEDIIGNFKKPLLVCHSPADNIVKTKDADRIFQTAKHPKSFLSLGNADHLLSQRKDAHYAGNVIAAWAMYHLLKK